MDRYLITGGTGFLGINFLGLKNKNIFLLAHKRKLLKKNNQIIYLQPLNKKNLIKFIKAYKINIIIHAAAITDLEFAENNKFITHQTNYIFTKTISDIASVLNLKIIFISTDQLYNSSKPSNENNKVFTLNYYSLTKLKSEEYIKKNNKKFWIIRCSFFGWGTRYKNTLVDFIYNNLKNKKNIGMWTNISFNPIYVSNLIEICLSLHRHQTGIYNVGSSEINSKYNFGLKIAKIMNLNLNLINETLYEDKLIMRPKNMNVDIKKISKLYPKNKFDFQSQLLLLKSDFKLARTFIKSL
ncbi:sugar nucleotide-binding protein [Alphaproteobacteria bacterium]|nr:sugar nucleotide-binding protein [Alphaproteobacteria bacterium]